MAVPESIQAGRLFLCNTHPYVAGIVWALRPVEVPGIGTMGVDQHWRLYYDPELDSKWTAEEVCGVLFHEINHLLRAHTMNERGNVPDDVKDIWNQAADMEINPGLQKLGFKLPQEGCFPSKNGLPDGLLAEEYFEKLLQQQPKSGKGKGQKGKPGDQEGKTPGSGSCGSCGGKPKDFEQGEPDADHKLSDTEKELIRRDVAKQIESHIKQQGTVPSGLDRWAKDYLNPKVPWQKELRTTSCRMLNEVAGKREYSFRKPSRRQSSDKVIFPSLRDFRPNVGIIRDTSGSMNDKDMARTLAETRGILDSLGGASVVDIEVDCAVHATKKVKSVKEISVKGGGGTDMGVGITHAATLRPKLDLVIVLTDGYTPWPTVEPPFKTIVLLTQKGTEAQVPSWAKCLTVTD